MEIIINNIQQINNCFEVVTAIVYYLFVLIITIGKLIYWILQHVTIALITASIYLTEGLKVFYEEFSRFCLELVPMVNSLMRTTENSIAGAYNFAEQTIRLLVVEIYSLATYGYRTIFPEINPLPNTFTVIKIQFKEWIIFIGNSCWLVITLIPNATVTILIFLYTALEISLLKIVYVCCTTGKFCVKLTTDIIVYFTDLPYTAACGCLCIMLIIYHRKYAALACIYGFKLLVRCGIQCLRYTHTHLFHRLTRPIYFRLRTIVEFFHWIRAHFSMAIHSTRTQQNNNQNGNHQQQANVSTSSEESQSPIVRRMPTAPRVPHRTPIVNRKRNSNDQTCVICQDRTKCIVLFPCKHLCLCDECSTNWSRYQKVCPLCREYVRDKIKVYT